MARPGPGARRISVAEWSETFLSLCRRLERTSQDTYRRDLAKYIVPRFGHYRIGDLPADEVESRSTTAGRRHRPQLGASPLPNLRRMLQVAVDKEKLLTNPCDRVEAPRVPAVEMTFLNWDEVIELADTHDPRFRALILFAVETGMRWSELVASAAATSTCAPGESGSPSSPAARGRGVAAQGTEDAGLGPLYLPVARPG